MRLHRLEIHNYKSLRNVVIEPTPLSVFVGPNAAGKTNLADAIDFLGHVYAWNLEKAVSNKGGYDSICFRSTKRSAEPIRFRVVVEFPSFLFELPLKREEEDSIHFIADHSFEFKSRSQGIQSPYEVVSERLVLSRKAPLEDSFIELRRVLRKGKDLDLQSKLAVLDPAQDPVEANRYIDERLRDRLQRAIEDERYKSGLLFTAMQGYGLPTNFEALLGAIRVFQVDPRSCREAGIPTPTPDLDRSGHNLPVALDHLKKTFPAEYSAVLETARRIMPTLERIETDWTHNRALTLFIKERGVRRPWTSEDVSTGTIQTIALLVAAFDPRSPLVVIEEPENSVHPWALRNLAEAFRIASEQKQIMLTTHSPILIDQLKPEEVWVVRKPGTETKIDPLLSLDPFLKESWGKGKFTLSEYLDSGAVPEAVPATHS